MNYREFRSRDLGVDPAATTLSCAVCAKYARQASPYLVLCHHLAICKDGGLPFDPDFAPFEIPEAARYPILPDFYQQLLLNITAQQTRLSEEGEGGSKFFPKMEGVSGEYKKYSEYFRENKSVEQRDMARAFRVAAKKSRKMPIGVAAGITFGKKVSEIQLQLARCKYPEDGDVSFIPSLILLRAGLIVKRPTVDVDYRLVLADLSLVEGKWLEFLPASQLHSLHYLKTLCQMKLRLFADAKVSLEKAVDTLKVSDLSEVTRKVRLGKMMAGMVVIRQNGSTNADLSEEQSLEEPRVTSGKNDKYPALSSKVDVIVRPSEPVGEAEYRRRFSHLVPITPADDPITRAFFLINKPMRTPGRGIVANSEILPGEIIAVEEPVAYALRHEFLHAAHTHCHHCLVSTVHLLPCCDCCMVMYCSLNCRDAAASSYHRFECRLGIPLLCVAYGSSFQNQVGLTLRILFSHPPEFWLEKRSVFNYLGKPEFDMDKYLGDEVYSSDDLRHLFNLENKASSLKEADHISYHSFLKIPAVTAHAMMLVRESGYLLDGDEEQEDLVSQVVSHLVRVARLNSVVMTEETERVISRPEDAFSLFHVEFGQGIYNTVSLFNHSCTRNAVRFNVGKKTVVVAGTPISPGEEVCLEYMFNLLAFDYVLRTNIMMSEFNMMCNCPGCEQMWERLSLIGLKDPDWPDPRGLRDRKDLLEKNFESLLRKGVDAQRFTSDKISNELAVSRLAGRKHETERKVKQLAMWKDVSAEFVIRPLKIKHCVQLKW